MNASTGAKLTLPAGVNTAADELHPGLSSDGRYMLFERMQLLPKLNGDIVPPTARTLFMLDRQTGIITTLATGNGAPAGPSVALRSPRTVVWGVQPPHHELLHPQVPGGQQRQHDRRLHRVPAGLHTRARGPAARRAARGHVFGHRHQPLRLLDPVQRQHGRSAQRRDDDGRAAPDGTAARRLRQRRHPGEPPDSPARRPLRRAGPTTPATPTSRRFVPRRDGADTGPGADHDRRAEHIPPGRRAGCSWGSCARRAGAARWPSWISRQGFRRSSIPRSTSAPTRPARRRAPSSPAGAGSR